MTQAPRNAPQTLNERAWNASQHVPLTANHRRCTQEVADRHTGVELMRKDLASPAPDPRSRQDLVCLLHNLAITMLAHQNCDPANIAEAIAITGEAVDRQAAVLTTHVDAKVEPPLPGESRETLESLFYDWSRARIAAGARA